jgi:hypothetical protein
MTTAPTHTSQKKPRINQLFLVLIGLTVAASAHAMTGPEECDLKTFPDFWADAQDRVDKLQSSLLTAEKENKFSQSTAKAFRQSLRVCSAKRKENFGDAGAGSGGVVSQMKCEAQLICTRLATIKVAP